MTKDEIRDKLFDDIYMRYWNYLWIEWLKDVHNMITKHLTSLQEPTEREVEIKYKKEKLYFKCICENRIYRWDNYCKQCWVKIRRIYLPTSFNYWTRNNEIQTKSETASI